MGGQKCPNCNYGFLVRTGKGRKRCRFCGFIKHESPHRKSQGVLIRLQEKKEKKEKTAKTPKEKSLLPFEKGYHSEEYKEMKFFLDQKAKLRKKVKSIEKILKKLRENKYSGLKEIEIEGELWDIKTGKLVREKEKSIKRKKETVEEEIEKMIEIEREKD